MSVGQMLSAKLDTNTILFWLNNWLMQVGITPKQAVVDYSKALLGGISFAFNTMSLKSYVRACFLSLINPQNVGGPAATFISIDVAHLMAIFCRLKCFNTDNKAAKDFFIRCVVLMVSCEDFLRFQEILLLTLTISIHSYDGEILNSSEPSPAEKARLKLINLIGTESHNSMKFIIDEESDEYKNMTKKMNASGLNLDPKNLECYINEEIDADVSITEWLNGLKLQAEEGKDTVHTRVNAYRLPQFYKDLCRLASAFVLWTAVMTNHFNSKCIRATSCYVEGDFGELKNT